LAASPNRIIPVNVVSILGEKSISGCRSGSTSDTMIMFDFTARHGITAMIEKFPMKD
jgi:D-arabinose 1-dehydrogenase-like Zn-dependent alcohol dehydrogenase